MGMGMPLMLPWVHTEYQHSQQCQYGASYADTLIRGLKGLN